MGNQVVISPSQAKPVELALEFFATGVGAQPPRAAATSSARAPVVTAIRNASVTAILATSTALGRAPFVSGVGAPSVVSVLAPATAAALVPVLSGGATVTAKVATATATAYLPVNNASVIAPIAVSTSLAPAPIIDGEAVLTGGGPGTATAMAYPPTVSVVSPTSPPAIGSVGTPLAGSGLTTADVPVPAGVAANDIILVFFYVDNVQAVTPPAGFTEATDSPVVMTSGVDKFDQRVYWKRATGADGGAYSFTIAAGLIYREAVAIRVTGCVTSGSPFDVTNSAAKTTNSDGLTPAVSVTTTGANRLLVWCGESFNTPPCSTVAGFTEIFEVTGGTDAGLAIDTKVQASAGSSGSLTATFTTPAQTAAWVGALMP